MEITDTSRYYGNIDLVDAYENKKLLLFCKSIVVHSNTSYDNGKIIYINFYEHFKVKVFDIDISKETIYHSMVTFLHYLYNEIMH